MPDDPREPSDIPLAWVEHDEVPVAFANQFIIQSQPDASFVISVGQATGPLLIGTSEQVAELAAQIEFVPVRTLGRFAVTEVKLRELIAALEANLANFEQARSHIDPRNQA
jgi:hypothetical protein